MTRGKINKSWIDFDFFFSEICRHKHVADEQRRQSGTWWRWWCAVCVLCEKLISPRAGVKLRLIVLKEAVAAEQGSMARWSK
jgi:hypothetical protein